MSGAKSKHQVEIEMKHSFKPFSDIIASCVPRCHSISAFADEEHNKWLCDLGWALHDVHAPVLERFLWWGEGGVPQIGLSHLSEPLFNDEAPILRDVRCTSAYLMLYQTPWKQITTLHLDGFGDSKTMPLILFSTIISECLSLDTLVMYGSVHQTYHLDETFILPSLRSLQLYGGTNLDVLAFSAPLLKELVLVPMRPQHLGSQFALATVRPHGSVLFPLLRSLTLSFPGDIQTLHIELEFAFECFPDIEQLTLIGRNNDTLDALFSTNLLWPKLRSLALKDVSEDDTSLLSDLISFRRENGCPLTQIRLDSRSLYQMSAHVLGSITSHVDVQEEDVSVTLHQDNLYVPDGDLYTHSGAAFAQGAWA